MFVKERRYSRVLPLVDRQFSLSFTTTVKRENERDKEPSRLTVLTCPYAYYAYSVPLRNGHSLFKYTGETEVPLGTDNFASLIIHGPIASLIIHRNIRVRSSYGVIEMVERVSRSIMFLVMHDVVTRPGWRFPTRLSLIRTSNFSSLLFVVA